MKNASAIIQLKKKNISRKCICQPQLFSTESDLSNAGSDLETLFFELFFFSFLRLIKPLTLIVCDPYGRLIYKLFQGEVKNALARESKPKSRFSG